MATVLEALQRKALRGVIREIRTEGEKSLICVEINGEETSVISQLPKREVKMLNLEAGDTIEVFPIDNNTYLIIGTD